MTDEKRLYRSREALIAGVCAGIADYFDVDPIVVRILAIVLTCASGGVLALAYIGLWIAVPTAPEVFAPLEVEPHEVRSDTYGFVDCGESRSSGAPRPTIPPSMMGSSAIGYTCAGHVPPEPPPAAAWYHPTASGVASTPPWPHGASYPGQAASGEYSPQQNPPHVGYPPQQNGTHRGFTSQQVPAHKEWTSAYRHPESDCQQSPSTNVKAALFIGSLLLSVGIGVLASKCILGVSWWQCWPLMFVVVGILRMVLPDAEGWRVSGFAAGLVLFAIGATLMPLSLGIYSWHTLGVMMVHLWPLLCIALGCLILGCGFKSSALKLAAALAFVAFCAVGLIWFGVPGPVGELVFVAPYGREYRFLFFG